MCFCLILLAADQSNPANILLLHRRGKKRPASVTAAVRKANKLSIDLAFDQLPRFHTQPHTHTGTSTLCTKTRINDDDMPRFQTDTVISVTNNQNFFRDLTSFAMNKTKNVLLKNLTRKQKRNPKDVRNRLASQREVTPPVI